MVSGLAARDSVAAADGTIYVSAEEGVYRRSPDGTLTQLVNKPVSGLAIDPDGTLYFAANASPKAGMKLPPSPLAPGCGSLASAQFEPSFASEPEALTRTTLGLNVGVAPVNSPSP